MSTGPRLCGGLFVIVCLACAGCADAPGYPSAGPEVPRPDQVMDFAALYTHNCGGCHGENGKNGVAISLANPVYLAFAGEANLRQVIAKGVAGKLMPAFERSAGGTLTGRQIHSLVQGILQTWSRPEVLADARPPSYAADAKGDVAEGPEAFGEFCSRCHGADGSGTKAAAANNPHEVAGSIVDPSFLALVSDQNLRTTIIAGRPDQGMPDWRSDASGPGSRSMTDQEITGVVAWLAAHRPASQP